jgi:hypothetical protein
VRRQRISGRTFVMPVHWLFAFGTALPIPNFVSRAVQRRSIHCALHRRRLFARYNAHAIEPLFVGYQTLPTALCPLPLPLPLLAAPIFHTTACTAQHSTAQHSTAQRQPFEQMS